MLAGAEHEAPVCSYGSLSREASSKSVSRFLGSKLRSECFAELRRIGLSRGECVWGGVCVAVREEVCEGVCAGLQVGSGVEVLPAENLACSLLGQKGKKKQVFNIMMVSCITYSPVHINFSVAK